ncbi:MAG: hypothetical protein JWR42_738 [Marmoricola sp.]|nr:hypothetical protein [Marmoricola sp.]
MIRLLRAELTRFRSRRAIALLALVSFAVAAVLVAFVAFETRPLSASDRADAVAQAELAARDPQTLADVRACSRRPADYLGAGATASDCTEALVRGSTSFLPRHALDVGRVLDGRGVQLGLVVVGLMVVAGSTFAGADWGTRALAQQLMFEPRRVRLWLAKGLAVTLGAGVVTALALGVFWTYVALLAGHRGIAVPHADVLDAAWQSARTVALGAGAALGAFAVTMALRHTVATLALLFVYAVGGEVLVNLLPVDGASRWAVGGNTVAWIARRHSYYDPTVTCSGPRCSPLRVLTHAQAGGFLLVVLVVVSVVSVLWFRRRDV